MPLLIATVGLPRSGKSTILRQLRDELHAPIVSRDAIRVALHSHAYEGNAEDFTRAIYKVMIAALFEAGHEVVLADETHYSKAAREHIIDPRWRTEWVVVETEADICIQRAYDTDQEYLVPIITEMAARYEPLTKADIHHLSCPCQMCTWWLCGACGYWGPAGTCNCPESDE